MQTKKRKEKFKVLTKIILLQLFNQIKFNIKSFILSCKLTFILKNKNNEFIKELLLNSFIFLLFISILIFTFYSKNDYNNNILFMLNGAIISIWFTHFIKIIESFKTFSNNLNRIFTSISTILQSLSYLYENLICFFPYNDKLFKKGSSILYVTPYGHHDERVLQTKSANIFINYFQSLSKEELLKCLEEDKVEQLIKLLNLQKDNIYHNHLFIVTCKECLPNYIIELFEQLISIVNNLTNFYQMYGRNIDSSLKQQLSNLCSVYVYKLTSTILFIQEEKLLYKDYISHISHPPQIYFAKSLEEAIILNKVNNI